MMRSSQGDCIVKKEVSGECRMRELAKGGSMKLSEEMILS